MLKMQNKKLSLFLSYPAELLTNCRPNGDGLVAFGLIRDLAQRGHTLHVAARDFEIEGELPANVHLHRVPTAAGPRVLRDVQYMVKTRRLLHRVRQAQAIDLFHEVNPVYKLLSLAMLGTGLPVILGPFVPSWPSDADDPDAKPTLRARAQAGLKRWAKNRCLTWQQQQAAAVIVTTPAALTSSLYRADRIRAKIHYVPLSIDHHYFTADSTPSPNAAAPSILFLANVWRRKGIFTLLDAFAEVVKLIPNCRLMIAGDGSDRAEVERQIAAAPHRDQIIMLGRAPRARVPELLRACTVYCLPSYGEPFGMSALEAMACGKPVVVTNAGGLGDLVPEEGGRKVPPRDAPALAQALLEILRSPELQRQMGAYNRRLVETNYSCAQMIERLETVYYSVLASHASQRQACRSFEPLVSATTIVDE